MNIKIKKVDRNKNLHLVIQNLYLSILYFSIFEMTNTSNGKGILSVPGTSFTNLTK